MKYRFDELEIDMTEEEFDKLSTSRQDQLIDDTIDWYMARDSIVMEEVEIWDVEED